MGWNIYLSIKNSEIKKTVQDLSKKMEIGIIYRHSHSDRLRHIRLCEISAATEWKI